MRPPHTHTFLTVGLVVRGVTGVGFEDSKHIPLAVSLYEDQNVSPLLLLCSIIMDPSLGMVN